MRIEVGEYVIESDHHGYMVYQPVVRVNGNSGEEYVYKQNTTYHGRVGQALSNILERRISSSDITTLEGLQDEIQSFKESLGSLTTIYG